MKKNAKFSRVMATGMVMLLALPMVAFADTSSTGAPIEQTPTAERITFDQILEKVDGKMKDRLIEQRQEVEQFSSEVNKNKQLQNDDTIGIQTYDPIDSYTYYEDNYLFYDVYVYNYTNADFGLAKTTWDYIASGETESMFYSGQVKHTMTVYGVTTSWPPLTKSYSHSSGTESNGFEVSIDGDDYSIGHWITALSEVEFVAGKAGEYISFMW